MQTMSELMSRQDKYLTFMPQENDEIEETLQGHECQHEFVHINVELMETRE